jgi:biopolymer transport protein TolQ
MPTHDLSLLSLFLQADLVVKSVMILLALASVACWSIILDRGLRLIRLRREAARFEAAANANGPQSGLGQHVLDAGRQAELDRDEDESRHDLRERVERAMREALAVELRRAEIGLPFLATIGSAGPFIGLFGTVWGIMNSFTAIAKSNDTSLAVVAPGIAEALFATAVGLAAAIPAVMAYNKLSVDLGRIAQAFEAGISLIGDRLSRRRSHAMLKAAE